MVFLSCLFQWFKSLRVLSSSPFYCFDKVGKDYGTGLQLGGRQRICICSRVNESSFHFHPSLHGNANR